MQHSQNTDTDNRDRGGQSSDMAETAIGSELLEVFAGAAIGQAFGIQMPDMPAGMDVGHVVDAIDEYHSQKQQKEFVLGQKTAITQDFNFGGQRYRNDMRLRDRENADNDKHADMNNQWRAKTDMATELANIRVPLIMDTPDNHAPRTPII